MKIVKLDGNDLIVYFDDDTQKQFKTALDYKLFLRSFGKKKPRKKRGKK